MTAQVFTFGHPYFHPVVLIYFGILHRSFGITAPYWLYVNARLRLVDNRVALVLLQRAVVSLVHSPLQACQWCVLGIQFGVVALKTVIVGVEGAVAVDGFFPGGAIAAHVGSVAVVTYVDDAAVSRLVALAGGIAVLHRADIRCAAVVAQCLRRHICPGHTTFVGRIDHRIHIARHEVDHASVVGQIAFGGSTDVFGGIDESGIGVNLLGHAGHRFGAQVGQFAFCFGQSRGDSGRSIQQVVASGKAAPVFHQNGRQVAQITIVRQLLRTCKCLLGIGPNHGVVQADMGIIAGNK